LEPVDAERRSEPNPYFDPADEAIPSFAGQWFDRFERGDDVTHWYGSQPAV